MNSQPPTRNYFHALLMRVCKGQNFFRLFPLKSGGFEVNLPPSFFAYSEPFETGHESNYGTVSIN